MRDLLWKLENPHKITEEELAIEFEQMEFQTFCKEGTDSELY